jgi:hypothetical protein
MRGIRVMLVVRQFMAALSLGFRGYAAMNGGLVRTAGCSIHLSTS